jgi:hypothetical protein
MVNVGPVPRFDELTVDGERVQLLDDPWSEVLAVWGDASHSRPPTLIWRTAPPPPRIYSPTVTSWLEFLADGLAAEFLRELQGEATR